MGSIHLYGNLCPFFTPLYSDGIVINAKKAWILVLSADNYSHLHLSFFGFERAICYVLNGHSIKSWPLTQQQVSERIRQLPTVAKFQKLLKELLD
jgi:hypothetical protein